MTLETGEFGGSFSRSFRRHWRLILGEGIFLLVLGALAILLPLIAGLVVAIALGWLLFLAGLLGLVTSVTMRRTPGFWWSLVSSIIAMAAGAMLFIFPIGGIVSLTLLLAMFLFADGVVTILLALSHREWASRNWGWLLLNGILDLFLSGRDLCTFARCGGLGGGNHHRNRPHFWRYLANGNGAGGPQVHGLGRLGTLPALDRYQRHAARISTY